MSLAKAEAKTRDQDVFFVVQDNRFGVAQLDGALVSLLHPWTELPSSIEFKAGSSFLADDPAARALYYFPIRFTDDVGVVTVVSGPALRFRKGSARLLLANGSVAKDKDLEVFIGLEGLSQKLKINFFYNRIHVDEI